MRGNVQQKQLTKKEKISPSTTAIKAKRKLKHDEEEGIEITEEKMEVKNSKVKGKVSSTKKAVKKRRTIIESDDDDDDEDDEDFKMEVEEAEENSDDVAETNLITQPNNLKIKPRKELKSPTTRTPRNSIVINNTEREKTATKIEISVDDYFAQSSSSKNSKKKKSKSQSYIDLCQKNEDNLVEFSLSEKLSRIKDETIAAEAEAEDKEEDYIPPVKEEEEEEKEEYTPEKPAKKPKKEAKLKKEAKPKQTIKTTKKEKKLAPLKPMRASDPISISKLRPLCLKNLTFVLTGVMPTLDRKEAIEIIKELGGKVTAAVSSKTSYLVLGEQLEDGRDVTDGRKYKTALALGEESCVLIKDSSEFYGLLATLSDLHTNENQETAKVNDEKKDATPANLMTTSAPKPMIRNPYAKKSTMIARKASPLKQSIPTPKNPHRNSPNALWADKYAPVSSNEIIGNKDSVKKLASWLSKWESNLKSKSSLKAALLSGPPGIGKTTTALLVSREQNRDAVEWNASDVRSKKMLLETLGDVTGSQTINFQAAKSSKKRVIIMDEVDGMSSGDRSGIATIIQMIKTTKVPIICICNDRQSQKLKSLLPYCLDLKYRRPVKTSVSKTIQALVYENEGMSVEMNALEALCDSCGNDIRQILNCLQMWKSHEKNGKRFTYTSWKEKQNLVKKDDMLRVSLFDATRMICDGPSSDSTLYKRSDAYFIDYNFMGLMVQQNYVKTMIKQYQDTKIRKDIQEEFNVVERMSMATSSMSDFALAEFSVRGGIGGNQNWQLLPTCAILAVKSGYHAAFSPTKQISSSLPGFPEFSQWLGKNSSKNKKERILDELSHHMNYNISTNRNDLRQFYIPSLNSKLCSLFYSNKEEGAARAIEFMDEYGLDRDDVFENFNEFIGTFGKKPKLLSDMDSKMKAAFTREYNKSSHQSQALVDEQGNTSKGKKNVRQPLKGNIDGDCNEINDDEEEVASSEDEEENVDMKAFMKRRKLKAPKSISSSRKKKK